MTRPSPRPLRVLTLIGASRGGAESVAREIAANLDRSRFDPVYCLSRWEPAESYDWLSAELQEASISLLGLGRRSRFELRPWWRLVIYMRQQRVDILHSHLLGSNAWGAVLARLAGVPVFVAQEHGWSIRGQAYRHVLDRWLIGPRADAFVVVSRESRRLAHEIEGIPLEKVRVIPNGIPDPGPPGDGTRLRAELGIAPEQPLIGAVATLRPEKALGVLVRAVVPLARRHPGVRVAIVGGGFNRRGGVDNSVRDALAELARELGIADRVLLLGPRSDIPNVLAALDVAVLCSDSEASPLALMEYMEAGKPVVATRVGGVPEVVEEGRTGILVEPQDPEGLANAIAELLDDRRRAGAMGAAGRERCRRKFSIEGAARRFEALYEELYAAKRPDEPVRGPA
jgi:glycosyltransferase involved in cell wall biosynthesis